MNILQEIMIDHYEEIEITCHPRDIVMESISKMIQCGDPKYGGTLYHCPNCHIDKFVPFHCHSRFCPSCGVLYSMRRTQSMAFKLISCVHRHCVFTIADNLRFIFLKHRQLLNLLFDSVNQVISYYFFMQNKSRKFVPGFICVLHTFGRDLKWNPHIHVLLTEGALDSYGLWRPFKYFNYSFLRKSFQMVLLNMLEKALGPSFKTTKAKIYKHTENGFYVHAKPNNCAPGQIVKYIGRYLGRPVIATSRIDKYDKENDTVTFHYNRHEDEEYVQETIPSMEFIKRLIRHIPDKHFKMIRYYGLYARPNNFDSRLHRAIAPEKRKAFAVYTTWRGAILSSFGYDPIQCPHCKTIMLLKEIRKGKNSISLGDMFKKVMRKHGMYHPPPEITHSLVTVNVML